MSRPARDGPAFMKITLLSMELVPGLFTHKFCAPGDPTRVEEEGLKVKVLNLDSPIKVYERDMLIALGAPVIYASLCAMHGNAIPDGMRVPFANCSCHRHEWFLGALRPGEGSVNGSRPAGSHCAPFLMACGELLYLVEATICCKATGLMTITQVLG